MYKLYKKVIIIKKNNNIAIIVFFIIITFLYNLYMHCYPRCLLLLTVLAKIFLRKDITLAEIV